MARTKTMAKKKGSKGKKGKGKGRKTAPAKGGL